MAKDDAPRGDLRLAVNVLTELLDYILPEELIATRPPDRRDGGRLCVVREREVRHEMMADFAAEIRPGDLVVLNKTKVRRARLSCRRPVTGGMGGARVELLFLHPNPGGSWSALGKANRPLRAGDHLLSETIRFTVAGRGEGGLLELETEGDLEQELERYGTMPIPPYMRRDGDDQDVARYQTVFSEALGSAAAPTAGLHLTEAMLQEFERKGAELGRIVLHVGVGTFRPVTVTDLDEHDMHSEWLEVDQEIVRQVARTRQRGGRVVAIGTTAVRALESARDEQVSGRIKETRAFTDLLIQPGHRFHVVDSLLTNFHQPKSTLLALVSAFAGMDRIKRAYGEALERRYRFLSYGDAMWIPQRLEDPSS